MYRDWVLLACLACPRALQGVGVRLLLETLLTEAFLHPVYLDVVEPLHSLYGQLEGSGVGVTQDWLAQVEGSCCCACDLDGHGLLQPLHITQH